MVIDRLPAVAIAPLRARLFIEFLAEHFAMTET